MGGIVVSALGLGAGYSLLTSKADVSDTANRLGALEAQARQTNDALGAEANRESAAVAALEKRIGALEASAGASNTADLDKRVAALEAASAGNGAASEATQRLAAQAKDLRADVDAEKGADSGIVGAGREARIRRAKGERRRPRSRRSRGSSRQDRGRARRAQD